MKKIYIIYSLICVFLVWKAPKIYDRQYCILQAILYLIIVIPFLYKEYKALGVVNFNTFFILAFFCINYLHAAFVFPDDAFLPAFAFAYNSNIIPKAVSLASLGFSFYLLGFQVVNEKLVSLRNGISQKQVRLLEKLNLFSSLGVFFYVLVFVRGGLVHLYPRLMVLLVAVMILSLTYKTLFLYNAHEQKLGLNVFIKKNKYNIASIFLFVLAQFMIGSRAEILFVGLPLLYIIHTYYQKIPIKLLLPIGAVAVIAMAIVMITRVSATNLNNASVSDVINVGWYSLTEGEGSILWMMLTDFLVCARTLYESVEYVARYGLIYGQSYVPYAFGIIPGLGVIATQLLLGKTTTDVDSGTILTGYSDASYGLGTNMIADMYLNCGTIGIPILMFLFGLVVKYSRSKSNKLSLFLRLALIATALYIPRASVFAFTDIVIMLFYVDFLTGFTIRK